MSQNTKTGGCATCGTDTGCSGSMLTCIHTKAHEDALQRRAALYGTALDDQAGSGASAIGFLSTAVIALACAAAISVAIAAMFVPAIKGFIR